MCGICGAIGLGKPLSGNAFSDVGRLAAALRHRGPDRTAVLEDPRCIVGNTRLKITDLSDNANLPMEDNDRSIALSYNGEITNFQELSRQFALSEKHPFRSRSDAEVLIYLYKELGIDLLKHVTGMFAFCLYDKRAKKVYLVRDFFGLRPVFYTVSNGEFYFASEIKALLKLNQVRRELNPEALSHYFSLAYIPGALTPFKAIEELEGGFLIEIDILSGRWEKRQYYSINYAPNRALSEATAAEEVHRLMLDSLRRNLISDKPVGLTLSGGVDTGSLLALAKELGTASNLHTFSIKMSEPSFDESPYQKILVDFAKPVHHEITVNPKDVLRHLKRHIAFLDEPSGDGAAIPLFLLAQEAKKHVSVLLSGEGGDEIFNAYETHRAYKVRRFYNRATPTVLRKLIYWLAHHLPVSHKKLSLDFLSKRFTEGAEKDVVGSHQYWRHAWTEIDKQALFRDRHLPSTESLFVDAFNKLPFEDDLDRLSWIDIKYYFIDDLMVKNDRMITAHSLEGRYPFMDRPLVEYAASIPNALKIRGLTGRHIQRKAMEGRMPAPILERPNMGLEMPYSPWFLDEFLPIASKYFSKENIRKTELLNFEAVDRLWREHLARKRDNGRALWSLLTFLVWFELFVLSNDYELFLDSEE